MLTISRENSQDTTFLILQTLLPYDKNDYEIQDDGGRPSDYTRWSEDLICLMQPAHDLGRTSMKTISGRTSLQVAKITYMTISCAENFVLSLQVGEPPTFPPN